MFHTRVNASNTDIADGTYCTRQRPWKSQDSVGKNHVTEKTRPVLDFKCFLDIGKGKTLSTESKKHLTIFKN